MGLFLFAPSFSRIHLPGATLGWYVAIWASYLGVSYFSGGVNITTQIHYPFHLLLVTWLIMNKFKTPLSSTFNSAPIFPLSWFWSSLSSGAQLPLCHIRPFWYKASCDVPLASLPCVCRCASSDCPVTDCAIIRRSIVVSFGSGPTHDHKCHIIFPRAMNSTKCFPHSYSAKLTATQSKHDKLTGNVWCLCWLQPIRH